jgi:hypothetical protein
MSQDIEKESLAAHVDICALRYENLSLQYDSLNKKFEKIEIKFDMLMDAFQKSQNSLSKIWIGTAGTVVAGILTTVIILLMK